MSYQEAIRDSDVLDGLNVWYLKFFGLWSVINDYRTTGRRNGIIIFQVTTTLLGGVVYLTCQSLSFFYIKVDIQKATFIVMHSISALQICSKVFVFWFSLERLCKLYNLIRKDFLTLPEYKRDEAKKITMKITKQCNILCMAAFLVNTSIVILFIAIPGISVDYIAHHTGSMTAVTGGKKKILGGWYPVPMAESPYYEIIIAYETTIMIWGGILLAVYACLFYQVLMCLYAQFSVLGYHISTLKVKMELNNGERGTNLKKNDSPIYEELYVVLNDHKKLVSYADKLRRVYNPLVTMILGMGIFVLVIAVFQFLFGGRGSPMFVFRSLQYVFYQGVEVSMFCFGSSSIEEAEIKKNEVRKKDGDGSPFSCSIENIIRVKCERISLKSSDLQFAIYSSDWYKADVKFRKAGQMLMVRARKGETLTAIRMYPVNVETIMSIFQFTYSVAALMSRMME